MVVGSILSINILPVIILKVSNGVITYWSFGYKRILYNKGSFSNFPYRYNLSPKGAYKLNKLNGNKWHMPPQVR